MVIDTATFIAASRSVHGNRYDYSLATWSGPSSKVIIICRVCGPFSITADSHYRKACGCRHCGIKSKLRRKGQYRVCPYCKKWAKYSGAANHCRDCKAAHTKWLSNERARKRTRECAKCGNTFVAKDMRSTTCGCKVELVSVACCICGTHVLRRPERVRDANCCSLKCQRKFAGYHTGYTGKLPILTQDHWVSWKCDQCEDWWAAIRMQIKRLNLKRRNHEYRLADPWSYAIRFRLTCSRQRVSARKGAIVPRGGTALKELKKIKAKRKRFSDPWGRKIAGKLTSFRLRRARKSELNIN